MKKILMFVRNVCCGFGICIASAIGITAMTSCSGKQDLSLPSQRQLAWAKLEQYAFVHFGVDTFSDREWGWGDENPMIFNPTNYDPDSWVKAFKDTGLAQVVLTCKHHDGFCLWPSQYTNRSVINSLNFKEGKGDVVKDVSDACHKYGLKFGIYLSPWDRSRYDYGEPSYVTYYQNQLEELLTNYGTISEVWFDGAQGGFGWYGGVDGEPSGNDADTGLPLPESEFNTNPNAPHPNCAPRKVDQATYYHWDETYAMVRKLQPNAVMSQGPDLRWCGNEEGSVGEPNWNTLSSPYPNASDNKQNGDEFGNYWEPAECDVSIYDDWFWHPTSTLKTAQKLFEEIYLKSVGRGAGLIINVPPNNEGQIATDALATLNAYKEWKDDAFKTLLAKKTNTTQIDLDQPQHIDYVIVQENIKHGQNVESFSLQYWHDNQWVDVDSYQTIGYKRIIHIPTIDNTSKIRIVVNMTKNSAKSLISNLEVYQSDYQ